MKKESFTSNFARAQLEQIWQKTLQLINESAHLDDAVFNAWYRKDFHLFDIEDDFVTIVVPYKISKQIMMDSIDLVQQKPPDVLDMKVSRQILFKSEVGTLQPSSVIERRDEILSKDKVKKEYTFDSFVVGENNRETHAAALFVRYYPGEFNNPLFTFGDSGLGETHLLHVISNYVRANKANGKVLYIHSEDFVTLLVEAMKNETVEDVREMICLVDYLLIDDTQRLKQNTLQEILFNMYNKLISDNKQIVITSDIHPAELGGIENRLISRFSSDLSVSVGSPEFETVKAILQKKVEGCSDEIITDDEALDHLVTRSAGDVRKLEGTLNELFFKAILYSPERIGIAFAKEMFKENPIVVKQGDELTPRRIKNVVYEYYGLTRTQIESKSGTKNIVNARHIAIYLCRTYLEMPFAKTGFEFGNRDHSTIMSSYEKMMKLLKEKEASQQAVMQVESNLGIE